MSNFSYITCLLKNSTANLKESSSKRIVYNNLVILNDQIQKLNRVEPEKGKVDGPLKAHKMTEEEYNALLQSYKNLKESIRTANKSGNKTIIQQQLDELMLMVNRDMEALNLADPEHLSDYKSMVNDTAHYTADIRGKQLDRIGGSSSSRFAMSVPDGKGGYVDGYFTADSRMIPNVRVKEAYQNAINALNGNDRLCEALKKLNKDNPSLTQNGTLFFNYTNFSSKKRFLTDVYKFSADPKDRKALVNRWNQILKLDPPAEFTDNELKSLYTLINEIYSFGFNRKFMIGDAHVKEGGVIGQRNAAMSAVADYLGVPNLIARSNQISVLVGTKNGKPVYKNGTFMEKATGTRLSELTSLFDPSIKEVNADTLELRKAVANLQVIDYICGNVDRHSGNYFIKSEVKDGKLTLTGLVGIDNDSAFGENLQLFDREHCLRSPLNMGRITVDMANRVLRMKKKDLQQLLAGFGLKKSEISSAWDRVNYLKLFINEQRENFALDDEAMKDYTLGNFHYANERRMEEDPHYSPNLRGIGTICNVACLSLNRLIEDKTRYYNARLDEYKQSYLKAHAKEAGADGKVIIPPEELKKIEEKANFVAHKQTLANKRIQSSNHKAELDKLMEQVALILTSNGEIEIDLDHLNTLSETDPEIYKDLYQKTLERNDQISLKSAEADYEYMLKNPGKNIAPVNQKANETKFNHVERLTGRAARLAEVQIMLKDVKSIFAPTFRDHGQSGVCQQMINSMENLLTSTGRLQDQETEHPDQYDADQWKEFDKQLKDTLDKTCFYISQKPYKPIHQYGKDRLDAARELRTTVMKALQMADDEMLAVQPVQEPEVVNVREENKKLDQKVVKANSLIKGM